MLSLKHSRYGYKRIVVMGQNESNSLANNRFGNEFLRTESTAQLVKGDLTWETNKSSRFNREMLDPHSEFR